MIQFRFLVVKTIWTDFLKFSIFFFFPVQYRKIWKTNNSINFELINTFLYGKELHTLQCMRMFSLVLLKNYFLCTAKWGGAVLSLQMKTVELKKAMYLFLATARTYLNCPKFKWKYSSDLILSRLSLHLRLF